MILVQQIEQIAKNFLSTNPEIGKTFLERLKKSSSLTRDEGSTSHLCVYFLPYNPKTKKIFVVHHKKSGLWLSPGGHVDKGELMQDALNREIKEELGVTDFFTEMPKPFLLSITPIHNPIYQPECKEHLDVWFLVQTDGSNFQVDPHEFHQSQWLSLEESKLILTDQANLEAVKVISAMG